MYRPRHNQNCSSPLARNILWFCRRLTSSFPSEIFSFPQESLRIGCPETWFHLRLRPKYKRGWHNPVSDRLILGGYPPSGSQYVKDVKELPATTEIDFRKDLDRRASSSLHILYFLKLLRPCSVVESRKKDGYRRSHFIRLLSPTDSAPQLSRLCCRRDEPNAS